MKRKTIFLVYPNGTNEKDVVAHWKKKNFDCNRVQENVFEIKEVLEGSFEIDFAPEEIRKIKEAGIMVKLRLKDCL